MIDRLIQAAQVFNEPMTLGMTMLLIFLTGVSKDCIAKPLVRWFLKGRKP